MKGKRMSYKNLISKVRYWDNITAKWLMRHFYFMFFQIVLVVIFFLWFMNLFNVIDSGFRSARTSSVTARILSPLSLNLTIVVFLMLLNSFWMLFMFGAIQRIHNLLKDINYHLSRFRSKGQ